MKDKRKKKKKIIKNNIPYKNKFWNLDQKQVHIADHL